MGRSRCRQPTLALALAILGLSGGCGGGGEGEVRAVDPLSAVRDEEPVAVPLEGCEGVAARAPCVDDSDCEPAAVCWWSRCVDWSLADSIGDRECQEAAACVLHGEVLGDYRTWYYGPFRLPVPTGDRGAPFETSHLERSWLADVAPGAPTLLACTTPPGRSRSQNVEPPYTDLRPGGLGGSSERVRGYAFRSADRPIPLWQPEPWGLPAYWLPQYWGEDAAEYLWPRPVIERRPQVRLSSWSTEGDCRIEVAYAAELPDDEADLRLWPRIRRWCGPDGPSVESDVRFEVVDLPVTRRDAAAVSADPAAERVGAYGEARPHRPPFVAECAELASRPYCDSDLECSASELCWWSRCVTREALERLRHFRCHEVEGRYDIAPSHQDHPVIADAWSGRDRQPRGLRLVADSERWTAVSSARPREPLWEARGRGSARIDVVPHPSEPFSRQRGSRWSARLRFEGRLWFGEEVPPPPATPVPAPAEPLAYVELRSWEPFGGCLEEFVSRSVHELTAGVAFGGVDNRSSYRLLCGWPERDVSAHEAARAELAACDTLWEAGDRAAFLDTCRPYRHGNARTWLRVWQVETAQQASDDP
jgi:hypothetical protein